jgi:hypothetical protein
MSSYREAWNAATKEGDRHMRCYGRTEWNKEDLYAAHNELIRQVEKLHVGIHGQTKGPVQAAAVDETG